MLNKIAVILLLGLGLYAGPAWALRMEVGEAGGATPAARSMIAAKRQPPLTVSLHLVTRQPRVGEPVVIEVKALSRPGVEVPPIEYPKELGDWEVLAAKAGERRRVEDHFTRVDRLTLRTFVAGEVEVPMLVQPYRGPDHRPGEFRSAPLTLKVDPVPPQSGDQPGRIRGLKSPRGMFSPWWVAALALLLAAAVGVVWWLRSRKRPETSLPSQPALLPEVVARERLAALRASNHWVEGRFKTYYSELSDILRRYLESRFQVTALDLTTPELMRALKKSRLKLTEKNLIREILDQSDMVKFAKFQPQEKDAQTDWEKVSQVVESTTPSAQPVAAGEGA